MRKTCLLLAVISFLALTFASMPSHALFKWTPDLWYVEGTPDFDTQIIDAIGCLSDEQNPERMCCWENTDKFQSEKCFFWLLDWPEYEVRYDFQNNEEIIVENFRTKAMLVIE